MTYGSALLAATVGLSVVLLSVGCVAVHETGREELLRKRAALLAYLRDVAESDTYLSGQRRGGTTGHEHDWEKLESLTGKLPAILCAEYCSASGCKSFPTAEAAMQWRSMNPTIVDHWNKGGLITITCHFPNPYNPTFGGLRKKVQDKGAAIVTDGTPERERWTALLEEIVKGVQDLNAQGVIPELRPLHESNGAWFWWGSNLPADVQQKLEDDFYTTVESAGSVVIWHKSWGMCKGKPLVFKQERYDIIGYDTYDKKARDLSSVKDVYADCLAKGKLFELSEFGVKVSAEKNKPPVIPIDCMDVIRDMDTNCPRSLGSVWWAGPWGIQRATNAAAYMNSPRIITLGEISYRGR